MKKRAMQKQIIALMIISLCILSCTVNKVNSITTFAIEGHVYDKASKAPLEHVIVYFVDTGYDDKRSKKDHRLPIGKSDENGEIKARLNYFWGYDDAFFISNPKKTFDIVLSKKFYKTVSFHFTESQLKGDKYAYFVKLEDVYMIAVSKDHE
jgi:hypothetical protein